MSAASAVVLGAALVYAFFWFWYGGRGRPLSQAEADAFLQELTRLAPPGEHGREQLDDVRRLIAQDDGREFVMQNLARYRARALYPAGSVFDTDPRAADRRYGRAIVWPLISNGNVPVFIARRTGSFIEPAGMDAWHYVAMVRYRSKRDFLRFALSASHADIFMHKWAALEKTHVFPVQPLVSLIFVRAAVAVLLAVPAGTLYWLLR
jgi:hypothetical protein